MQDVAGSRVAAPTTPFSTRLLIESPDCCCYIAYHTSFTVTGYLVHAAASVATPTTDIFNKFSLLSLLHCLSYQFYSSSCMQNKERLPKQTSFILTVDITNKSCCSGPFVACHTNCLLICYSLYAGQSMACQATPSSTRPLTSLTSLA